jgi:hypothetical protein
MLFRDFQVLMSSADSSPKLEIIIRAHRQGGRSPLPIFAPAPGKGGPAQRISAKALAQQPVGRRAGGGGIPSCLPYIMQ